MRTRAVDHTPSLVEQAEARARLGLSGHPGPEPLESFPASVVALCRARFPNALIFKPAHNGAAA